LQQQVDQARLERPATLSCRLLHCPAQFPFTHRPDEHLMLLQRIPQAGIGRTVRVKIGAERNDHRHVLRGVTLPILPVRHRRARRRQHVVDERSPLRLAATLSEQLLKLVDDEK
jgi:hypothetical protein